MRSAFVALLVAGVVSGVVGCTKEDPLPPVDGPVVQPGRPGEDSKVLDEAPRIDAADATDADIAFVQMMIPHHAQALRMAELAPRAGGNREVRMMADRIDGAQRPEIVFMAGWLTDRDLEAPTREQIESGDIAMDHTGGHSSHGSGMSTDEMPGMATQAQLDQLAAAKGKAFDRLFLELMVNHHQGALEMVDTVVRDGGDQQINELATGIAADQTAEIQRMRDLLTDLP